MRERRNMWSRGCWQIANLVRRSLHEPPENCPRRTLTVPEQAPALYWHAAALNRAGGYDASASSSSISALSFNIFRLMTLRFMRPK